MYSLPPASTATPAGPLTLPLAPPPPSPPRQGHPFPATFFFLSYAAHPFLLPFPTRPSSDLLPLASSATPVGTLRLALVAAPPSPAKLLMPLPATVVMIPV